MQIICVSRGSLAGGKEVAGRLARDLGYPVLSREDMIAAATAAGIPVGKLETSMLEGHGFSERLARARDHYLAFSTAYLCERAIRGPLVYHGRSGHLLLRGVPHVLRVRVIADEEYRLRAAMSQLGLDRERARRYLAGIEDDRRNWVRSMYGVSWEDALQYDVVLNVGQLSVENAAAALVRVAQLPEFQLTPASQLALDDLCLCANARLRLARDPRTRWAGFTTAVHERVLTVTYLPSDMEVAEDVPRVLEGLEGAREIRTTMATTTILWVQESFSPQGEVFGDLVEIAGKWNAAVELVRFSAAGTEDAPEGTGAPSSRVAAVEGGIEEDSEELRDASGMRATADELDRLGRSGGARTVAGDRGRLLASCCATASYSLVVLGKVFLDKDPAARQRLTRELQESLASRMRVPVVTGDELRRRYLFGPGDMVRLAGSLLLVIALYLTVFRNQEPILEFLARGAAEGVSLPQRLLVGISVFVFAPVIAYTYGVVMRSLMKLIKME